MKKLQSGMMDALDSGMEQLFEITSRSHGGLVGRWTAGQVREIMREARARGWTGLRAMKCN